MLLIFIILIFAGIDWLINFFIKLATDKENSFLWCFCVGLPSDFELLCLSLQLSARSPVGQATVCGSVGLGPHVQERLHGSAVIRSE